MQLDGRWCDLRTPLAAPMVLGPNGWLDAVDVSLAEDEFAALRAADHAVAASLTAVPMPLVEPAFVLAEILLDQDPLRAALLADLLRCLEAAQQVVDLEDVRVLLRGVRAGDPYDLLASGAASTATRVGVRPGFLEVATRTGRGRSRLHRLRPPASRGN